MHYMQAAAYSGASRVCLEMSLIYKFKMRCKHQLIRRRLPAYPASHHKLDTPLCSLSRTKDMLLDQQSNYIAPWWRGAGSVIISTTTHSSGARAAGACRRMPLRTATRQLCGRGVSEPGRRYLHVNPQLELPFYTGEISCEKAGRGVV